MWILFAVTIAADACQADPGGLWQGAGWHICNVERCWKGCLHTSGSLKQGCSSERRRLCCFIEAL